MCKVRPQCLLYALDHNETFGIWGGTSDVERRRLKQAMRVDDRGPMLPRRLLRKRPVSDGYYDEPVESEPD